MSIPILHTQGFFQKGPEGWTLDEKPLTDLLEPFIDKEVKLSLHHKEEMLKQLPSSLWVNFSGGGKLSLEGDYLYLSSKDSLKFDLASLQNTKATLICIEVPSKKNVSNLDLEGLETQLKSFQQLFQTLKGS